MEDIYLIDKLILFGLGRQESAIYVCLLKHGALTGYEVSKITGISRSNVYNSLAALVEHGAAYIMEGSSSKYLAVPIAEFCDNHIRYLTMLKDILVLNSPKEQAIDAGYVTIEGISHIHNKIHHMLAGAEQRVYFSAAPEFLQQWESEIHQLLNRNCKVVLLSDSYPAFSTLTHEEKSNIIYYEHIAEEAGEEKGQWNRREQLQLIVDSKYVLTGTLTGQQEDTCLYSAQHNFVNAIKDGMRNEIRLIELLKMENQ